MTAQGSSDRSVRGQRGQVLVIVALALVALVAFVGLAVDVGYWYGERRHMQNAADAGALAGAYQLCYEADKSESAVTTAALDYAEDNGAARGLSSVQIHTDTGTVVVTAVTPAEFFFARVISSLGDFNIPAVAAAQCGEADEGCGMWPVAMDMPSYQNTVLTGNCNGPTKWDDGAYIDSLTPNSGEGRAPGSQFILWASDNNDKTYTNDYLEKNCWFQSNPVDTAPYDLAPVLGGTPMDPGSRGWVRLQLLPGYDVPADSGYEACGTINNCGADALKCWLRFGYIGSIAIGDCLAAALGAWLSSSPGPSQLHPPHADGQR